MAVGRLRWRRRSPAVSPWAPPSDRRSDRRWRSWDCTEATSPWSETSGLNVFYSFVVYPVVYLSTNLKVLSLRGQSSETRMWLLLKVSTRSSTQILRTTGSFVSKQWKLTSNHLRWKFVRIVRTLLATLAVIVIFIYKCVKIILLPLTQIRIVGAHF